MSLRRYGPLALAFASLVACKDVEREPPADQIVIATLVPPVIPTPNDLALQAVPTLPVGAQRDLLQSFVDAGGFPSDQEVTVNVPFRSMVRNENTGAYEPAATVPPLDLATVTPATAAVIKVDGSPQVVETEAAGFANGVLTLRKKADASGSRRWAPGRYVIAVRGGERGVRTTAESGALTVAPDQAIALVKANKDLTVRENQPPGGLPAATVARLEGIRASLWSPLTWGPRNVGTADAPVNLWAPSPSASVTPAFPAVDVAFPHEEVAAIATFGVAPAALTALTDSGSGQIPFPSSFLLDGTRPVEGTDGTRFYVRNVPAFGPAAAGLSTLDGFSTTGMMLAPLSGPAQAATITSDTVLLFELPTPAQAQQGAVPRRMRDVRLALGAGAPQTAEYLTQPPALNRTVQVGGADVAVTTAIGLQPGVPVPTPTPAGIVYTPPLEEKSNYLVVITDGVKDAAGQPIKRSTLANILFTLEHPPVDEQGRSQLAGVADADARALHALRTSLDPILTNLGALSGTSLTKDDVVMAYTVQTQTVTDVSVKLSAVPYASPAAFAGQAPATLDLATLGFPADAMTTLFPAVDSFITAMVPTIDALNPATGALNPNQAAWAPTAIPALIAVPKCATLPTPCAAPLAVWLHGQGGGHLHMLTTANALADKGFVVAAVDMPYHGDRAFCARDSDCTTDGTADGVCTPDQARAGQGDAVPPGTCTTGHLRGRDLTTAASGNYFLSSNFFRTRDIIRQQLIDQAALVLSLARPPVPAFQPPADPLRDALAARGVGVDPRFVYFVGHSQGGETGTLVLATNPRFSRGALNAVGGTMVDIFTTAPAFKNVVDALFLSIGIDRSLIATDPAVASRYLQTLTIMKWIVDPAEPLNYARNLEQKLPSPLLAAPPAGLGGTPFTYPTTEVLGQLLKCDQRVTNASTLIGGVPQPYGDLLLALGGVDGTLYASASAENGCVPHAVALDTFAGLAGETPIGDQLRDDAAQFLLELTYPGSLVTLP